MAEPLSSASPSASSSAAPKPSMDLSLFQPPKPVAGASPEALASALANSGPTRVLEVEVSLPAAERVRLEQRLAELHDRAGGRAYVVLVPPSVDVEHYAIAPLYERLGLHGRDVLILVNGLARHLRTAGLPKEAGGEILRATRDAYKKSPTDGLVAMLDEIERRFASATPASTVVAGHPVAPSGLRVPLPVVVLGSMVLALIVLSLLRRRRPPRGDATARR